MKNPYLSFYFDEDVSVKIADNLRNRGFDTRTTLQAKNLGASDDEQLDYSAKAGRVLVSHNPKDFLDLHGGYLTAGKTHSVIVLVVRQKDPYRTVARLLHLVQNTPPEDMRNQLRY